jgi:hypothetical protein
MLPTGWHGRNLHQRMASHKKDTAPP